MVSEGINFAIMRTLSRIMILLLAVLTISGHGMGPSVVFHAHGHSDHTSAHATVDAHGHEHHSPRVVAERVSFDTPTADCLHDQCGSDDTGAHFHITCCATVLALPSAQVAIAPSAVISADLPLGHSSLLLGEKRYPLLRPPRRLI
jgi:hypothetical protein